MCGLINSIIIGNCSNMTNENGSLPPPPQFSGITYSTSIFLSVWFFSFLVNKNNKILQTLFCMITFKMCLQYTNPKISAVHFHLLCHRCVVLVRHRSSRLSVADRPQLESVCGSLTLLRGRDWTAPVLIGFSELEFNSTEIMDLISESVKKVLSKVSNSCSFTDALISLNS